MSIDNHDGNIDSEQLSVKHKCNKCHYYLNGEYSVKEQIEKDYKATPSFTCHQCTMAFEDKNVLNSHVNNHHNQMLFCTQCETCSETFEDGSFLDGKKQNVHVNNFHCKTCDNRCAEGENMSKHMDTDHVSESLNKIDSTKSSLLKSFQSVSEEEQFSQQNDDQNASPFEATFFNPSLA